MQPHTTPTTSTTSSHQLRTLLFINTIYFPPSIRSLCQGKKQYYWKYTNWHPCISEVLLASHGIKHKVLFLSFLYSVGCSSIFCKEPKLISKTAELCRFQQTFLKQELIVYRVGVWEQWGEKEANKRVNDDIKKRSCNAFWVFTSLQSIIFLFVWVGHQG